MAGQLELRSGTRDGLLVVCPAHGEVADAETVWVPCEACHGHGCIECGGNGGASACGQCRMERAERPWNITVLKFRYLPERRSFRVEGDGWIRIATEEMLAEALANESTLVNRILCLGAAA